MKLATFLIPAALVAQSPDQGLRDRLKALSQVPTTALSLTVTAQFDVREFFSKSHLHSEADERLQLKFDGTTVNATGKGKGFPMNWTSPVLVNPGEEDPLEPGKLDAWIQPYRLNALLAPSHALLGVVQAAKWKETKEAVFEGEMAKQHTYVFKTRVPKKFEFYAIDRESTLVLTTTKDGLPLLAELTTGYRGRVGRTGPPFGRRTHVRWKFRLDAGVLLTTTYDIREDHRAGWTTTNSLIAFKSE